MDINAIFDRVIMADMQIDEGRRHIAELRRRVKELNAAGSPVEETERLLALCERAQGLRIEARELLLRELSHAKAAQAKRRIALGG
jgi:regulator of replication initiation timing